MFTENSDPIKDMHIGYIGGCQRILEKIDGIILTKSQSEQERKMRYDSDIWNEPGVKTAADFKWLDKGLLTKTAATSIVIAQFDNEFEIYKNIKFPRTVEYRGNIEDLYDVIMYWYNKKRKWRQRKKWRDIEGVGHIYI